MLPILQKIDKELETALANLDREKEEALKDLDAQVRRVVFSVLITFTRAQLMTCCNSNVATVKQSVCRLASYLVKSLPECYQRV